MLLVASDWVEAAGVTATRLRDFSTLVERKGNGFCHGNDTGRVVIRREGFLERRRQSHESTQC